MMVLATAVVSFALADEIRDINLCLITIESRIGNCPPWQPRDWMVVVTTFVLGWVVWEILDSYFEFPIVWMVVEFRTSGLMVVPMLMLLLAVWSVDMRHGNSAWRIYLLFVATLRQYVVVPALAAAAPTLAMFDSANAKDIGLNVLGTLFLLQIDNDAFACALPDKMRRHVLAFGRAEIGEAESRRISVATSWSWPLLCVAMMYPILVQLNFAHRGISPTEFDPEAMRIVAPFIALVPSALEGVWSSGDDLRSRSKALPAGLGKFLMGFFVWLTVRQFIAR